MITKNLLVIAFAAVAGVSMSTAYADYDRSVLHGTLKVHHVTKHDDAKVAAKPLMSSLSLLIACLVVSR